MASQRVAPQRAISQRGISGWDGGWMWELEPPLHWSQQIILNASSLRCDPQGRWKSRSFNGEDSLSQGALSW